MTQFKGIFAIFCAFVLPVKETEEEKARSSKAVEAMTVNKPTYCSKLGGWAEGHTQEDEGQDMNWRGLDEKRQKNVF